MKLIKFIIFVFTFIIYACEDQADIQKIINTNKKYFNKKEIHRLNIDHYYTKNKLSIIPSTIQKILLKFKKNDNCSCKKKYIDSIYYTLKNNHNIKIPNDIINLILEFSELSQINSRLFYKIDYFINCCYKNKLDIVIYIFISYILFTESLYKKEILNNNILFFTTNTTYSKTDEISNYEYYKIQFLDNLISVFIIFAYNILYKNDTRMIHTYGSIIFFLMITFRDVSLGLRTAEILINLFIFTYSTSPTCF